MPVRRPELLASLASLALGLSAAPLAAQTDGGQAKPPAIDAGDIVVTANRRASRLQDTPLSVTAFSAENIQQRGIADVRDIAAYTPNLNVGDDAQLGSFPIVLRGIGTIDPDGPTQDNPIAIYVDDVYLSRPFSNVFLFPDVERIEVLRGPQGTLFGRNASGGAIQFVSLQPGSEFRSHGDFQYASRNDVSGKGYVMGPLGGNWGFKVAAGVASRDGWARNATTGQDFGGDSSAVVRGSLRYKDDATDVVLQAEHGSFKFRSHFVNRVLNPGQPIDVNTTDQPHDERRSSTVASLRVQHDFDAMVANLVFAYARDRSRSNFDSDSTASDLISLSDFDLTGRQYSFEGRLASNGDGPLKWMTGVYLFAERNTVSGDVVVGSDLTGGPQLIAARLDNRSKTRSAAVFGELTYTLLPDLELTGGLRYTRDHKSYLGENPLLANPVLLDDSRTWGAVTPRVIAKYQPTRQLMLYASATRGFRSGTWSVTASDPDPAKPEYVWNYEAGVKAQLFDRLLSLNLAAFHTVYSDKQERVIVRPGVTAARNATSAKIDGFEAEFRLTPTDRLTLSGSLGLLDARYGIYIGDPSDAGPGETFIYTGNRLPRAPKLQSNLSLEYVVPLASGDLRFQGDWQYQGRAYFSRENSLVESSESFNDFNAQISWSPDTRYRISAYVTNIANERHPTQVLNFNNPAQGLGSPTAYNLPRTAGVRFSFDL